MFSDSRKYWACISCSSKFETSVLRWNIWKQFSAPRIHQLASLASNKSSPSGRADAIELGWAFDGISDCFLAKRLKALKPASTCSSLPLYFLFPSPELSPGFNLQSTTICQCVRTCAGKLMNIPQNMDLSENGVYMGLPSYFIIFPLNNITHFGVYRIRYTTCIPCF